MATSGKPPLTFLRGSGFLLSLVGSWDLLADTTGRWPAQRGFLIFNETKITAVIERDATQRRGLEGTYAVEGNRLIFTAITVDTASQHGPIGAGAFVIDGDLLTITWHVPSQAEHTPPQVDTFRRRGPRDNGAVLPPVAIYTSDASHG